MEECHLSLLQKAVISAIDLVANLVIIVVC